MKGLINWLRFARAEERSSGIGYIIVCFVGFAALFVIIGFANQAISARKTTPEIATIVGFGVYEGRWHAGSAIVTARDHRGRTGSVMVDPSQIRGCHVGDAIRAGAYGLTIDVDPAPCPIKLERGEVETGMER